MDSIIPLGQKNTLAEYMILFGADNRPPMLDKDLYDSWKSQMELYMQSREHGRMILDSIKNGPLIWPTIEENAINIILQDLPADIYSLVNHHRFAIDLWERVQLLMQGISLTKQERECKLYDAFEKFTYIKRETLHKYYLSFTQLINDMNIYNMRTEEFQVNTKFLNSLPPKWGKFMTDVKLVKDLHTTNFDQLHPYLEQHKLHANEVRLLCERNQDPLAFVANQKMTSPHFNTYQDDLIACLKKAMAFLTVVASSRFPSTNNQLRTSLNPRNQATIKDADMKGLLNITTIKTEDLDTYDYDCDDISNAQAVLMAYISNYGSDVILEVKAKKEQNNESVTDELERYKERVKTFEQHLNIDLGGHERMIDSKMDDMIKEKLALKEQVDSLEQNLSKQINEKECLLQTFTAFKRESKEDEAKNIENEIDLE
uniref:Integrase, catalytic region, zinc finger, CCHC-type, peptidase aspartic, catalytic n=1 Tax=Tanacetum cinerariifolium TaxID=118510 RepID=A0A6L2L9A7_TANCI|nr:hypothetical protein [Tanacetum cinerariifolium]